MIDLKVVREQPDRVRENLNRRGDAAIMEQFEKLLTADTQWRELKGQEDTIRSERNTISRQINEAKKAGTDASALLEAAKGIPAKLAQLEEQRKALEEQRRSLHLRVPNLLDDSVPQGKDDSENRPIRRWGEPKKPDFPLRTHGEIVEMLGGDFTRATKLSGAGFYFLRGNLALLNQALIQFAINHLVRKGYTFVEPPLMMRREPYEGVTDLSDFEKVQYQVEGEDLKLIATAEHPLVAQYMGEELRADELPIKLAGYSMCFRKEIGSHGVDTKGLFRTHQFNKVEQVIVCKPADSARYHEELLANGEELFQALDIPYEVVDVCTGDMGIVASKKYDTNAWMPRQQAYREVQSCSNCTDYQARRLNIRFQDKDGYTFVHTLNNTAIATSRALVAILENNQQKDGSVLVPAVLRPYMGGKMRLEPAK